MGFEKYEVHPFALAYPEMGETDFEALQLDIMAHGLKEPIRLFEGKILDGRHRQRAIEALRLNGVYPLCHYREWHGTEAEAAAFVRSMNLHRRHLTAEQKRALIEAELKANPSQSDRQIAEQTKTSHPTVAKVRKELEQAGDVENLSTRRDSVGREQPSTKPQKTVSEPFQETTKPDAMQLFFEAREPSTPTEQPIMEALAEIRHEQESALSAAQTAPDWRVYVREQIHAAEASLRNAIANIPTSPYFGASGIIEALEKTLKRLPVCIMGMTNLPGTEPVTEEVAVAILQEETVTHEAVYCFHCGDEIAMDGLGGHILEEREADAGGTLLVLETGVRVWEQTISADRYYCAGCPDAAGRDVCMCGLCQCPSWADKGSEECSECKSGAHFDGETWVFQEPLLEPKEDDPDWMKAIDIEDRGESALYPSFEPREATVA